jgi:hypothetical protein
MLLPIELINRIREYITAHTKKFTNIDIQLPINILEYLLSKYAVDNGCNIVHTINGISELTNENTVIIFDATGGRLLSDGTRGDPLTDKSNWYAPYNQQIGDGFNLKPITFIGGIMCVSIGDSLYMANYGSGTGIYLSLTFCFIIVCLLYDYITLH